MAKYMFLLALCVLLITVSAEQESVDDFRGVDGRVDIVENHCVDSYCATECQKWRFHKGYCAYNKCNCSN
ncbi:hypothetical protein NPIL_261241 [Nephila pilipes]|uniref:Defensin n=1 Tax=Nephila pilipes TaxID=299642 RepID=A0A8X6IVZ1_NEPPI|nr:hypothetical protein NPIL_261241 [Nephila pilipes]